MFQHSFLSCSQVHLSRPKTRRNPLDDFTVFGANELWFDAPDREAVTITIPQHAAVRVHIGVLAGTCILENINSQR